MTKTLQDIKNDMSELYEEVKMDRTEIKKASEMANIAGKFLKAEQLELANKIFDREARHMPRLPDTAPVLELTNGH